MSNFLAVATVTAALNRLIQETAGADVPGATVTTDRPETATNGTPSPTVNIYLYQVAPNVSMRNDDLPTRSSDGDLVHRPVAALDLHYLFTFSGADDELEPQRLLGSVVRTLHTQPFLTQQLIAAVKTAATANPPVHPALATTNLGDQVARIAFAPLPMNLEELSKLWSVFFQTPYALSIAYQASVVLIEPDLPIVTPLPVLERDVEVEPLRLPVVDRIVAAGDPLAPIVATSRIEILGRELLGDVTRIRLAGADRAVTGGVSTRLSLDLASITITELAAGPQTVQVVHRSMLGLPPAEHIGVESPVATFVLHPLVSTAVPAAGPSITVTTDLTVSPRQAVQLALLDPFNATRTHLLAAGPHPTDTTSLHFPAGGVATGPHVVQVLVDGAESPLERDGAGNVTGPTVVLP